MKLRILIIDDEPGFANLLKKLLERLGSYDVRTALTGREGIAMASAFHPHLILLDMVLPDLTGGEVSQLLAADQSLRNTQIVLLTALSPRQETPRQISGFPLLAKSGRIDSLLDYIREHLEEKAG